VDIVWWVAAAVLLIAVELLSLDLVLLMLAGGAVAGAIVATAGGTLLAQALAAFVVSLLLLVFVRPLALRHLQVPKHTRTGVEALVGTHGLVLERVDARDGRVKLGGEVWYARSSSVDVIYEAGAAVHVVRIDGATALVEADAQAPGGQSGPVSQPPTSGSE
jgi:membrane protein implicated in regulation of membrane protease activity